MRQWTGGSCRSQGEPSAGAWTQEGGCKCVVRGGGAGAEGWTWQVLLKLGFYG